MKNEKKIIIQLKKKNVFIPIILIVICIIGIGVGIGVSSKKGAPNGNSKKISPKIVDAEMESYFVSAVSPGFGQWCYRNNQTSRWMNYEKGSVKQDASNKNKLDGILDVKPAWGTTIPTIKVTIQFDWPDERSTQEALWKQMTSQINKQDYYVIKEGFPLSGSEVESYIEKFIKYGNYTWYGPINKNKVTFITTDIKINSDQWFTENLKPGGRNKNVPIVLKWMKKADENQNDIISAIKAARYSSVPQVFLLSAVKKTVNDYLADKIWFIKDDPAKIEYKCIASNVIKENNYTWWVTINATELKNNNSMAPFLIALDWKDQSDATSKLSEIDTEFKKHNILLLPAITSDKVLNIFKNFVASGIWNFSPKGDIDRVVVPIIDPDVPNGGINPSYSPNYVWDISTKFNYKMHGKSYIQKNKIQLNWKFAPDTDTILKDIVSQFNIDKDYKFTFKKNK